MKKFWKTTLAVAMSAFMAASLAACGGGSSSSSAPANTESEAPSGAIKIGGSGPLTGPAAVYGNAVKTAAEMAVEEINAKGGVQFELQFEDDKHDAEEAATAFGTLMDGKMQISLATVTSAPGAAVAPLYQENQIFAITPSGSSPSVIYADGEGQTGAYGNVFQMCFSDPNQGSGSATYIAAHPDLGTKVAVIYKNDDPDSKGIFDTFKAQSATEGLEIVYEGTFKGEESDFNVQLKDAQSAGADLLFLPIYYTPASQILTQANTMGYKPTIFGVDGMDGILGVEGFDTSLAEGVYLLTPFVANAEDELTKTFVENYKAKAGEVPNQFAADAYDCIYAMAQACEAAGITADMSNDEICTKMVEQFTSMTFNGLTGSDMTWNENGEVTKAPKAMIIENGEYVPAAE
ncbi:MAG: ABC transporter substrate-binding protein [Lachnospiraceae bacterium]|nr:ABC transporter substrate-binding protein [Lachnospiraceae bacterium]